MIKEYIKGSILDAPQKYIAHGVNCQNVMGSGVAKVLFEKYPDVKTVYHTFCREGIRMGLSNEENLGDYCVATVDVDKYVINAFTQEFYGRRTVKYVSYDAIFDIFKNLADSNVKEVAIPKIGCGLAGGNWEIVSRIIDDATGDDLDVYVYYLED
jgi:O-acetyl-ADP-ribose deacetylase (regulator of RNase III)